MNEEFIPQYWDDILYPSFRATIRGEYYGVVSQDFVDEELYNLACRAIVAFKFPKISTDYTTFYAIREDANTIREVAKEDEDFNQAIPHAYFNNTLTYAEIEIILAWMKVYWCENQISNADNFYEIYTDANIKTYSRANLIDKNIKLMDTFRKNARELETTYSRVSTTRTPTLGSVND